MQIFCFLYKANGYILYFCTVFFIVLDLRLSRLGYGGSPFFMPLSENLQLFSSILLSLRHENHQKSTIFRKNFLKNLVESKNSCTFAPA